MAENLPDTKVFDAPSVGTPKALKEKKVFDAPTPAKPKVDSGFGRTLPGKSIDPGFTKPMPGRNIDPGFTRKPNVVNPRPSKQVTPRPLPANTPKSGRTYQNSNTLPDRGANAARRPMINPTQQPTL